VGIPSSKVTLTIPVDSLKKLPDKAGYSAKDGQASAKVSKDGNKVIVTASCDSLEKQVELFESLYIQSSQEGQEYKRLYEEQLSLKRSSNSVKTILESVLAGMIAGALLTLLIYRKYDRKKL
jgi:hypothetical protein